jgi:hypothetical protein
MEKNISIQLYGYNSKFYNYSKRCTGLLSMEQFFNGGRQVDHYRETIDALRKAEYKSDEYLELKRQLPLCSIASYSKEGISSRENISEVYNVISVDIDQCDNVEFFKEHTLDEVKNACIGIPGCFCAMLSCGGKGIVLYFLVDDVKQYGDLYWHLFTKVFASKGIVIDAQTKDLLTRRRYISYDDDKLVNWDVAPLTLTEDQIAKLRKELNEEKSTSKSTNKLFKGTKAENKKYTSGICLENLKFNDVKIDYLDNKRRQEYVSTVKSIFGCDSKYKQLVKEIYDYSLDGKKHNIKDAYNHIDVHWNGRGYGSYDNIVEELISLGVIVEKEEVKSDIYNIELKEGEEGNQWLYDKKDEILERLKPGITLLVAGTGVGKTEFWNQLNDNTDLKICIVEPYNSISLSKYDKEKCHIAVGTGHFIDPFAKYQVTNYNKFIELCKNDTAIDFDVLVLDESHLTWMQDFRSDVLVPFLYKLNELMIKYPNLKIIFQTATEAAEHKYFDVKSSIIVNKKQKRFSMVRMSNVQVQRGDEYEYNTLMTITKRTIEYYNEGRKVLVYWSNGPMNYFRKLKKLLALYKVNLAIVHRKNECGQDYKDIFEYKELDDKYDAVVCSCMFGVGCDLNDKGNTAVIIVGNNPVQEDVQTIGRWRKSKNVVTEIIMNSNVTQVARDYKQMEYCKQVENSMLYSAKKINRKTMLFAQEPDVKHFLEAIQIGKYRYSDIKTKVEYFKERKEYLFTQDIKTEYNIKEQKVEYNIVDSEDGILKVDLIQTSEDDWKNYTKVLNGERTTVEKLKEQTLNTEMNRVDFIELENRYKEYPTYVDWVKALRYINYYGDINEFIENTNEDEVLKVSYNNIKEFIHGVMLKFEKEWDNVEYNIIQHLFNVYSLEDNKKVEVEMAKCYAHWVLYNERDKDSVYDMIRRKGIKPYVIYQQFRKQWWGILHTNETVRTYLWNKMIDENKNLSSVDIEFFGDNTDKWEIKEEEVLKVKNKHISMGILKDFFSWVKTMYIETDTKNKESVSGKIGGKANKTNSNKGNSGRAKLQYEVLADIHFESRDKTVKVGFKAGDIITTDNLPSDISESTKGRWIKKQLNEHNIQVK